MNWSKISISSGPKLQKEKQRKKKNLMKQVGQRLKTSIDMSTNPKILLQFIHAPALAEKGATCDVLRTWSTRQNINLCCKFRPVRAMFSRGAGGLLICCFTLTLARWCTVWNFPSNFQWAWLWSTGSVHTESPWKQKKQRLMPGFHFICWSCVFWGGLYQNVFQFQQQNTTF